MGGQLQSKAIMTLHLEWDQIRPGCTERLKCWSMQTYQECKCEQGWICKLRAKNDLFKRCTVSCCSCILSLFCCQAADWSIWLREKWGSTPMSCDFLLSALSWMIDVMGKLKKEREREIALFLLSVGCWRDGCFINGDRCLTEKTDKNKQVAAD